MLPSPPAADGGGFSQFRTDLDKMLEATELNLLGRPLPKSLQGVNTTWTNLYSSQLVKQSNPKPKITPEKFRREILTPPRSESLPRNEWLLHGAGSITKPLDQRIRVLSKGLERLESKTNADLVGMKDAVQLVPERALSAMNSALEVCVLMLS